MNKSDRLYSLDALRGFDMFWITGGAYIFGALSKVFPNPFFQWINMHTHHAEWNGFRMFDLIFPMFIFIAGVSMPYSIGKRKSKGQSATTIYKHIFIRIFILIALGIVYNGFFKLDFENLRYASVLGRIGLAWGIAAILFMNFKPKSLLIWFFSILLGYWAILKLIPVPGYGAGDLSMEGSIVGYVDRLLIPGVLYNKVHDPEGILSTIPAVANALAGVLTGLYLKSQQLHPEKQHKALSLLGTGIICIGMAYLWNLVLPINKNLWSSSFALLTVGWSLSFLAVFYQVIDIWKIRKWSFIFVVIGLNPITIYMAQNGIINFWDTAKYFTGGLAGHLTTMAPLINSISYFSVSWLFLYFLYKKKIFLRI